MTEPTELLPCPFCGSKAVASVNRDESLWSHGVVDWTRVHCTNDDCNAQTEATCEGYEPSAIEVWNRRTPQPVVLEPSEAEIVFAAISSGEWTVTRNQPSCYLTDEGNARNAWSVQRAVAPYCADLGPGKGWGNRVWNGPTALAALKAASKEMGIPLPITQKGGSNAE